MEITVCNTSTTRSTSHLYELFPNGTGLDAKNDSLWRPARQSYANRCNVQRRFEGSLLVSHCEKHTDVRDGREHVKKRIVNIGRTAGWARTSRENAFRRIERGQTGRRPEIITHVKFVGKRPRRRTNWSHTVRPSSPASVASIDRPYHAR